MSSGTLLWAALMATVIVTVQGCFMASDVSLSAYHTIDKVELISVFWNLNFYGGIRPEWVVEWRDAGREADLMATATITDEAALEELTRLLNQQFEPYDPPLPFIDARIVCLLHNRDKSVDTLSFGGMKMLYNRNLYRINIPLLRYVATFLPQEHRDRIENFGPLRDS